MVGIFAGLFLVAIILPSIIRNDPDRWLLVPWILAVFVVITVFTTWAALRRNRRSFETYKLMIDDEKIVREQFDTPTITIYKRNITDIVKNADGSFTVTGDNDLNAIGIPSQIDRYHRLEEELRRIRSIHSKNVKSFAEKMFVPVSLFAGLLIAVTTMTENTMVDLICSGLLVTIMTFGMAVILVTKNVDKKTKRLSWIFVVGILWYAIKMAVLLRN